MSISYPAILKKVRKQLVARGRDITIELFDASTTPDATKPWRQTASVTPTKTFTIRGLGLDMTPENGPPGKTLYLTPPTEEPDVIFDERWIVTVGTEKFSVLSAQRIDPDGLILLWELTCAGWPKPFGGQA